MTIHWALMCVIPLNPHHNYMKLVLWFLFYTGGNWGMISRVKPLCLTPDPELLIQNRLHAKKRVNVQKGKWTLRASQLGRSFRRGKGRGALWDQITHHLAESGSPVLNPSSSSTNCCVILGKFLNSVLTCPHL